MSAATRADRLHVSDTDLDVLRPQYEAVLKMLRDHKLMWPLDDLAARVTLKVVAMTWKQVTEIAPELREVPR